MSMHQSCLHPNHNMNNAKAETEFVKIRKKRSRHHHPKRKTIFWLMIIILVTFILSAITLNIPTLIDKYLNFADKTYRPMDTDRIHHEQEKQASAPINK